MSCIFPENASASYIFTPEVTEGEIFIFPSFIRHFCPPNKNLKERTIMSFDVNPYITKKVITMAHFARLNEDNIVVQVIIIQK